LRTSRKDTGLRRLGFDLFHRFFALLSDFPVEPQHRHIRTSQPSGARGLSNGFQKTHRFFPGLRSWVGFERAEVTYDRQERAAGQPKQTFAAGAIRDGWRVGFSRLPLRMLTYLGLAIALSAFMVGMYFVIRRLIHAEIAPTGFTTLVTLLLFLGGVQLIGIGVLGEYLGVCMKRSNAARTISSKRLWRDAAFPGHRSRNSKSSKP